MTASNESLERDCDALTSDACMIASRAWASSENAAGICGKSKPVLASLNRAGHSHAPLASETARAELLVRLLRKSRAPAIGLNGWTTVAAGSSGKKRAWKKENSGDSGEGPSRSWNNASRMPESLQCG